MSHGTEEQRGEVATRPNEADARALQLLREGRRFLLASHVRPDGDGIGSQAGLASVLQALGKEVRILNPDPPSGRFDFFTDGLDLAAYTGDEIPEHDVAVLLDISELSRCGELGERIGAASSRKLVVDHHIHEGDAWWDEAFIDPTASATGLLVYRIARALGVPLDAGGAAGVFTAIVSDTGWFRYSNTDAETLAAAGDLVAGGVEPATVYRLLHQREEPGQPGWIGGLLARTSYHADRRLAVVDLPLAEARVGGQVNSDLVLDVLRSVESVEVVLFVRELEGATCKLSARSKTDFDVNRLARGFGGGGHRKASGATLPGPLDEAVRKVVDAALEQLGASSASEVRS